MDIPKQKLIYSKIFKLNALFRRLISILLVTKIFGSINSTALFRSLIQMTVGIYLSQLHKPESWEIFWSDKLITSTFTATGDCLFYTLGFPYKAKKFTLDWPTLLGKTNIHNFFQFFHSLTMLLIIWTLSEMWFNDPPLSQ